MNPPEFLAISSAGVPEREALVSGDGRLRVTYEQMAARVNRLANISKVLKTVLRRDRGGANNE